MPTAALLIVGSEMLDPERRDANGPYARARLAELGIPLALVTRVEDRLASIGAALGAALEAADIVLTSGGLGPTGDDLTREAVAAFAGTGIHEDAPWLAELEERFRSRGRVLNELGRRQALIVDGATAIPNPRGLACGTWLERGGRAIVLLPGVPSEFRAMLDDTVLPRLAARFPERSAVRVVRAVAAGLPEVEAEPVLGPWYGRPGVAVSILPSLGVLNISFSLSAPPIEDLDAVERDVRRALAEGLAGHLVSLEGQALEAALGQRLLDRGYRLAVAESCTGGTAARRIVTVPGASRYFVGGIEAYANEAKRDLLRVPDDVLARHGAVSAETAEAMVRGAQAVFGAECAIATTGIAGPDGGTPEKPVGLVYVAAATPTAVKVDRLLFPLDRVSFMELVSNHALFRLWRLLG